MLQGLWGKEGHVGRARPIPSQRSRFVSPTAPANVTGRACDPLSPQANLGQPTKMNAGCPKEQTNKSWLPSVVLCFLGAQDCADHKAGAGFLRHCT